MQITILTLFPETVSSFLNSGLLKKAQAHNQVRFELINWREFTTDKHKTVDDHPFGGGTGMLLMIEPIVKALRFAEEKFGSAYKILLTPQGQIWNQSKAYWLLKKSPQHLLLLCGHYEGFDERILDYIDEQISIGNYVLSGGEAAAMVIIDSLVRLIPGVLKKETATQEETFMQINKNKLYQLTGDKSVLQQSKDQITLLEYPQYTKPTVFEGKAVPQVLLSGNHQKIHQWRVSQAWKKTKKKSKDSF